MPIRNRDDLSMIYTPGRRAGLPGHRREPRRRPAADHQAQHRRGGHRRHGGARAGRHRPARGAAGDGGQGRPVQALRRHRRLPDLPRHPRHRGDHRARSRRSRRSSRASTSRTSPRRAASRSRPACARSSTSRSSTTTSTARPSSCWPPCATRCGSSASELEDVRVVMSGAGAAGTAILKLLPRGRGHRRGRRRRRRGRPRGPRRRLRAGEHRTTRWIAEHTNPRGVTGSLKDAVARGRRVPRRLGPEHAHRRRRRDDGADSDRLRAWPTRTPRSTRPSAARHAAVVATGRCDFAEPDQQRAGLPGRLPGPARLRRLARHRPTCCSPPPRPWPTSCTTTSATRPTSSPASSTPT